MQADEKPQKIVLDTTSQWVATGLSIFAGTVGGAIIGVPFGLQYAEKIGGRYIAGLQTVQFLAECFRVSGSLEGSSPITSIAYQVGAGIGGAIATRVNGAVLGFSLAVLDEIAISKEWYGQHYLLNTGFWYSMSSNVAWVASYIPGVNYIPKPIIKLAAGIGLSAANKDILDYRERVYLSINSFTTVLSLMDEHHILTVQEGKKIGYQLITDPVQGITTLQQDAMMIAQNPFLSNYVTSVAIGSLNTAVSTVSTILFADYSNDLLLRLLSKGNKDIVVKNIHFTKDIMLKGAAILALMTVRTSVQSYLKQQTSFYTNKQSEILSNRAHALTMENDHLDKLLAAENGVYLLSSFASHLEHLYDSGFRGSMDIMQSLSSDAVSLRNLKLYAPDLLINYTLLMILKNKIHDYFHVSSQDYTDEERKKEWSVWELRSEFYADIEQIIRRDGKDFYLHLLAEGEQEIKAMAASHEVSRLMEEAVQKCVAFVERYYEMLFFGYQVVSENLNIVQIPVITSAIWSMIGVFRGIDPIVIEFMLSEKKQVEHFLTVIEAERKSTLQREYAEGDHVIFKDFVITLHGKELMHIDYLALKMGWFYAFTGLAGCGKSSTLISMKEDLKGNITSSGTITYPLIHGEKPNVAFLTQDAYLPTFYGINLLQTIYFPQVLPKDTETLDRVVQQVIQLLGEFEMRGFNPAKDTKEDMHAKLFSTEFQLSGGETSKVMLISTVLRQPHILLLDETFRSLDPQSRIYIQHLIKKYLPESLVILVTHDDRISTFFNKHVHFVDGSIQLYDTPSYDFLTPSASAVLAQPQSYWDDIEGTVFYEMCAVPLEL